MKLMIIYLFLACSNCAGQVSSTDSISTLLVGTWDYRGGDYKKGISVYQKTDSTTELISFIIRFKSNGYYLDADIQDTPGGYYHEGDWKLDESNTILLIRLTIYTNTNIEFQDKKRKIISLSRDKLVLQDL